MCFQGRKEWDVSFYLCFCADTHTKMPGNSDCAPQRCLHSGAVSASLTLSQHNTETNLHCINDFKVFVIPSTYENVAVNTFREHVPCKCRVSHQHADRLLFHPENP